MGRFFGYFRTVIVFYLEFYNLERTERRQSEEWGVRRDCVVKEHQIKDHKNGRLYVVRFGPLGVEYQTLVGFTYDPVYIMSSSQIWLSLTGHCVCTANDQSLDPFIGTIVTSETCIPDGIHVTVNSLLPTCPCVFPTEETR